MVIGEEHFDQLRREQEGEKTARELSLQQFDCRLKELIAFSEQEQVTRRRELEGHLAMMHELRAQLDDERSHRDSLEMRLFAGYSKAMLGSGQAPE